MSTSVMEPGIRLAGRFRLEDRVSEAGGSALWKATDEVLARAVAVRTFEPGFPRVDEVITAARASSRLTDPRLTQVFDADDTGERAYVVTEWIIGETLEDMLADGPLDPDRAAALVSEAAEALAAAHAAGLAHLRITPRNLVWTRGATVKLTGLGIEAALAEATSDDPPLADTRELGQLLYAALTGHWPGKAETTLPGAPYTVDGAPYAPRQVESAVPPALDTIACRALHLPVPAGEEPFASPAEVARALAAIPKAPLPFTGSLLGPPPAVPTRETALDQPTSAMSVPAETTPAPGPASVPPARHRQTTGSANPRGKKPLAVIAAGVALVVLGVGGWQLMKDDSSDGGTVTPTPAPSKGSAAPLKPKSAEVLDPRGKDDTARKAPGKAIDGNARSMWKTQHYFGADFGRLQDGIGLTLDMGSPAAIDSVKVNLPGSVGGSLELRVGDSPSASAPLVASHKGDAGGVVELKADRRAKGRYVILWFTKLPKAGGQFRAQISNVVVHGVSGG